MYDSSSPSGIADGTADLAEGTHYHLEGTLVDMLAPFQPLSLALVWAVHRELTTYRVVLLSDYIVCIVVAAVFTGQRSLATSTILVFSHGAVLNVLATAEGT